MKSKFFKLAIMTIVLSFFTVTGGNAQVSLTDTVTFVRKNLSGPRMGASYFLTNQKKIKKTLQTDLPMMSQFGWQFEWGTYPLSGGPSFIVELIPFISGVEYGLFTPSVNLMLGIRLPSGYEFGLGPNFIIGAYDRLLTGSLVCAVGKTINMGGVYIPVNFALITGKKGSRLSFIFGYAI